MRDYVPQLATLVKAPPSGADWWHEIKFDGYRIGCHIKGDRVRLTSRNGKDWTAAFPEIVEAVRTLPVTEALLDGEIAVVLADGRTSFQALQNAMSNTDARASLTYFVFDVLFLDGTSLESRPLAERKELLAGLLTRTPGTRIRFSEHVEGDGRTFLARACSLGLEGVVSKRRDRPYRAGRTSDWVKAKCSLRQEFVIGGFTDPEGRRAGLGALLIGYYDGSRLVFSGKVGTGFTHAFAVDLRRRLDALERPAPPFDPEPPRAIARRAHWVKPELVCEVSFTEWTSDGMIRHPSFQGLRADKKPRDVRAERTAEPSPAAAPDMVCGVRISHPDRVLYADPGISKIELARYYERIGDWILPHVAGRPLTLVRCPEGLAGKCSYMKHSKVWAPEPLRRVTIQEKTKRGEYLIADDLAAVVGLVQMGILEIHTWNTTFDDLERPNRIVIDLDPGDDVRRDRVAGAARIVRNALSALDLESYCKTTGGRGLHVVAPLVPHADWSACLSFAQGLSEAIERMDPDSFTTAYAKRGRGNKILLDYLRNNRTNTSVAAYSSRAREHAPVSVPIGWDELRRPGPLSEFTVATVPQRLSRLRSDPWDGYWKSRQKLTQQRLKAVQSLRIR